MEDSLRETLKALAEEADGLADDVENSFDEHATYAFMRETRRRVDDLSRRYHEVIARVNPEEKLVAERMYGRRIVDVQKMAARLPAASDGRPAEKIAHNDFLETRAPKSSRPPVTPGLQPGEKVRDRNKISVTDEIDAWCGRCGMVRSQVVAAVVGDLPAQVVCQTCGSRARYREGPARAKKDEPVRPRATPSKPPPMDPKQKEKNELIETLRAAENPRKFSPKERYKVGEIIEHPEHGRGKVENTLPRSLLVRFAGGLKPVKLG